MKGHFKSAGGRIPNQLQQPEIVEPDNPLQGGKYHFINIAPGAAMSDDLCMKPMGSETNGVSID